MSTLHTGLRECNREGSVAASADFFYIFRVSADGAAPRDGVAVCCHTRNVEATGLFDNIPCCKRLPY